MGLGPNGRFRSPCKGNDIRSLKQKFHDRTQSFGRPFLVMLIDAVSGAGWWEETDMASDPSGPLLC